MQQLAVATRYPATAVPHYPSPQPPFAGPNPPSSSSSSSPTPPPPAPPDLRPYHSEWRSLIDSLPSLPPLQLHSVLSHLHALTQKDIKDTSHCSALLSLGLLSTLSDCQLLSSRYPDQSLSALSLSIVANLCQAHNTPLPSPRLPNPTPPTPSTFLRPLLSAVHSVLRSPSPRPDPPRCQAYRGLWTLMHHLPKLKADPCVTDPQLLRRIAQDLGGASEPLRQMAAAACWAMGDSRPFAAAFLAADGVDRLLAGLQVSMQQGGGASPSTLYVQLSFLHILCTDPACKKRILGRDAMRLVLTLLRAQTTTRSPPAVVVGRICDLIAAFTFTQPPEQVAAGRLGTSTLLAKLLEEALTPRSPLESVVSRLCIAAISLCYRSPLAAKRPTGEKGPIADDIDRMVATLTTHLQGAAGRGGLALIPIGLGLSLLSSQSGGALRMVAEKGVVRMLALTFIKAEGAGGEERKRMQQAGLFMLLPLLHSTTIRDQLSTLPFVPLLQSVFEQPSLFNLALRVLALYSYGSPAIALPLVDKAPVFRRTCMAVLGRGGMGGHELQVLWAAGALYAMMSKESLGREEGMKKLEVDVNNSGEAQRAVRRLEDAYERWKEQTRKLQQMQQQHQQQQMQQREEQERRRRDMEGGGGGGGRGDGGMGGGGSGRDVSMAGGGMGDTRGGGGDDGGGRGMDNHGQHPPSSDADDPMDSFLDQITELEEVGQLTE